MSRPVPQSGAIGVGFDRWLAGQTHRDDPVGVLARDAAQDPAWPEVGDCVDHLVYLVGCRASDPALKAMRAAWREWEARSR